MKKSLLERVGQYFLRWDDVRIVQMAEVAPHAIAVRDNHWEPAPGHPDYGKCGHLMIYFDLEYWEALGGMGRMEEKFGVSLKYHDVPSLKEMGMGQIYDIAIESASLDQFLERVKASSVLEPKTADEHWYDEPKWLEVPSELRPQ